MKKTMHKNLLALSALLALAGCSNSPGYFEPQPPTDGYSMLYLYRPKADNPGMQPLRLSYPDIQIDGRSVGVLKFNTRMALGLTPGEHQIRVTGLSKKADWEPRDIEQKFSITPGETKYLKLDVAFNTREMNLGQPGPAYTIFLTPMRSEDALYEIRNTSDVD
jgi:hypothetical protein